MTNAPDRLLDDLEMVVEQFGELLTPALLDDQPRAMTDASLLQFTRVVESLGRLVDAARLAAAAELDNRSRSERGDERLSRAFGCASTAELLVRLTKIATATAKERISTAGLITTRTSLTGETLPPAFPALREAAAAGHVGHDTITAIARTLGSIADRCQPGEIEAAEAELVAVATGVSDAPPCSADESRIQAKVWAAVLDPDGALPEHERAMRRRSFVVGRECDGLVRISGSLIPDVAEQFTRLLHAHLSPRVGDRGLTALPSDSPLSASAAPPATATMPANSTASAALPSNVDPARSAPPGTGPAFGPSDAGDAACAELPPDDRTRVQRQHDALAAILGIAARSAESPSLGGAAPTLLVTIAASELESATGIAHIDGSDTALPAYVARHIACRGGVQRLVFDDVGRIIELGSPQRVFTAAQRRAIVARDGGCVITGCHVPAAWCEIHHVEEHARGGPTHTDNGVMLCWFHHRTLETNGWAVKIVDGIPFVREPRWHDPGGTWKPARGSAHLQRERLRRRRSTG